MGLRWHDGILTDFEKPKSETYYRKHFFDDIIEFQRMVENQKAEFKSSMNEMPDYFLNQERSLRLNIRRRKFLLRNLDDIVFDDFDHCHVEIEFSHLSPSIPLLNIPPNADISFVQSARRLIESYMAKLKREPNDHGYLELFTAQYERIRPKYNPEHVQTLLNALDAIN